jgi:hypothetical protein
MISNCNIKYQKNPRNICNKFLYQLIYMMFGMNMQNPYGYKCMVYMASRHLRFRDPPYVRPLPRTSLDSNLLATCCIGHGTVLSTIASRLVWPSCMVMTMKWPYVCTLNLYLYIHIYSYVYICIFVIYICICMYISIYTYGDYTYIHIYMHIHTS